MDQLKRNSRPGFAELHPPLGDAEALVEAARCLYCYDAPCTRACPTHIDIPRFIRQVLHRDPLGAARTILDANILGGSCARVCPTQVLCEGACVENTHLKSPVLIGRLQRYACDAAHDVSMSYYAAGPDTGRSVAVIGAGPAGLACAHELRKRGNRVIVFDSRNVAGGLNTLGIAAYKQSTEFALTEVERVRRVGVEIRLKQRIDAAKLRELLAEHDAVFLAVGLGRTAPLSIPGEELKGVVESLDLIARTHTQPHNRCRIGKRVIVIGGGNTAMDAANAAVRLGAESVVVAYRRDREAMPAFAHEVELAAAGGVRFEWLAQPVRIVGRGGRVRGVRFVRTRLRGKGRRAKLTPVRGSDFELECDTVIKALGQEPLRELLGEIAGVALTRAGRVEVDPATMATGAPKLFAGGDCRAGAMEEVVSAVQDGKLAAAEIHARLCALSAR